ncbi:MAG: hypothetical protein AAFX79_10970 [Planctomycetota bacterium]
MTRNTVCAIVACAAASAHADIFTDRASFDAAVAAMSFAPAWDEDFEGFGLGLIPTPTIIGGGAAEIDRAGTAEIIDPSPIGTGQAYLGVEAGIGEIIQGVGGTSLGVTALGFDYFSELDGMYNFNTSSGIESAMMTPGTTPLFVGWVGDPGETLDFVDYTPGTSAHILDNMTAAIPAPGTAVLFAIGGLAAVRRRR